MKKIKVPEGMLEVAVDRWIAQFFAEGRSYAETLMQMILEAALLWLTEHPILPNKEQAEELTRELGAPYPDLFRIWIPLGIRNWQKIMFLQPEPEVPEEIKDLLIPNQVSQECFMHPEIYNKRVREAYSRGQKRPHTHMTETEVSDSVKRMSQGLMGYTFSEKERDYLFDIIQTATHPGKV